MDAITAVAITSFVFIHLIQMAIIIYLYIKYREATNALGSIAAQLVEFSQNVAERLEVLKRLVLASSPMGAASLLLGGVPGAAPGLSVEDATEDGDGSSVPFPGQNPIDPDEDDDITTLGEMLGK